MFSGVHVVVIGLRRTLLLTVSCEFTPILRYWVFIDQWCWWAFYMLFFCTTRTISFCAYGSCRFLTIDRFINVVWLVSQNWPGFVLLFFSWRKSLGCSSVVIAADLSVNSVCDILSRVTLSDDIKYNPCCSTFMHLLGPILLSDNQHTLLTCTSQPGPICTVHDVYRVPFHLWRGHCNVFQLWISQYAEARWRLDSCSGQTQVSAPLHSVTLMPWAHVLNTSTCGGSNYDVDAVVLQSNCVHIWCCWDTMLIKH